MWSLCLAFSHRLRRVTFIGADVHISNLFLLLPRGTLLYGYIALGSSRHKLMDTRVVCSVGFIKTKLLQTFKHTGWRGMRSHLLWVDIERRDAGSYGRCIVHVVRKLFSQVAVPFAFPPARATGGRCLKVLGPHWLRDSDSRFAKIGVGGRGRGKCSHSLWAGHLNSLLSAPNLPAVLSFPVLGLGLKPHFRFAGYSVSLRQ